MTGLASMMAAAADWGIRGERMARQAFSHAMDVAAGRSTQDSDAYSQITTAGCPAPVGVQWHESGDGHPLVLLNGIGVSGLVWPRSWVRQLERDHHVIRIDTRGTGCSQGAPTPFTMADLADDVVAVLDAVEIGRATLLGMSMGGMIAQEFALRHPERVEQLVLVSSIPPAPAHVPTTNHIPVIRAAAGREWSGITGQADIVARFYLGMAAARFRPSTDLVDELAMQLRTQPTPIRGWIAQARAVVAWRDPERLTRVGCPTTIIAGRDDPVVKFVNSERLSALIPDSTMVALGGVGHMIPWESPDGLLAHLPSDER